jgi:hypothetical protein
MCELEFTYQLLLAIRVRITFFARYFEILPPLLANKKYSFCPCVSLLSSLVLNLAILGPLSQSHGAHRL